jgi:hypothetical protein
MPQADKPKIEDLAPGLAFWNAYREARFAKGTDVAKEYANWTDELAQGLTSPGAKGEFAELCESSWLQ